AFARTVLHSAAADARARQSPWRRAARFHRLPDRRADRLRVCELFLHREPLEVGARAEARRDRDAADAASSHAGVGAERSGDGAAGGPAGSGTGTAAGAGATIGASADAAPRGLADRAATGRSAA